MPFLKPYLCIVLAAKPPARYTKFSSLGAASRPQTPTPRSDTYPCQPPQGRSGGAEGPSRPPQWDDYLGASPLELTQTHMKMSDVQCTQVALAVKGSILTL